MKLRTLMLATAHWLLARAKPSYVVIYDDATLEGEDFGENYYGFFADPAEAVDMFGDFRLGKGTRYHDAKLCAVLQDIPLPDAAAIAAEPPAMQYVGPVTRKQLFSDSADHVDTVSKASALLAEEFDKAFRNIERWRTETSPGIDVPPSPFDVRIDADFAPWTDAFADIGLMTETPPCQPFAPRVPTRIVVTAEEKVVLALEHLRSARDLLRDAKATKTLERVRLAISSAKGARRHAGREKGGAA